jgi:PAS domain S-box-containing protein
MIKFWFILAITAVTVLFAVSGWAVYDSRLAALRQAEQQEGNVALAIEEHIARSVDAFDQSLRAAIRGLDTPHLAEMDAATQSAILFTGMNRADAPERVMITDETGRVRYASPGVNVSHLDVSGRPQFVAQRDQPGLGLFFGPPIRSIIDGVWVLGASRRINHPDGSFAGIAMSRVPIRFFEDMFKNFDVGAGGTINLVSTDGLLIARSPMRPLDIGRDLSAGPLFTHLRYAPVGSFETTASTDGVRRLYTYRKVDGLPFVVGVGIARTQIYAEWSQKTAIFAVVMGVTALLALMLIWALWREFVRRGRAEAAAHFNEQRLELLLANVADHAIYSLEPDGRVATWNSSAEQLKGYSAAEIIGRPFDIFFTPEELAAGEPARLLAYAREHGRVEGQSWRMRKDNSRFWARIAITAIYDGMGTLQGFAKTVHDLTIRNAEELQRSIMIEAAPNGMLIIDEAGIISMANAQAEHLFGYRQGTLAGQAVGPLIPDALTTDRPIFVDDDEAERPSDRQMIGRRRDGDSVAIEVLLRRVRTPLGNIVIVSVFDTTERLRIEAEHRADDLREHALVTEANARLEELAHDLAESRDEQRLANEAKSRFLASLTHELRTPLNGILGYAQLLGLEGGLTPSQAERVRAMQGAGEHLLGMISGVLDLSQIEADRIELHLVDVDLLPLARTCLDLVRPSAKSKSLTLTMSVAPGTPSRLIADATRLRQVLVNLLGNAVKFTSAGRVALLLRPHQDAGVRLEISDTGPGIAADERQKLFQEFERLGNEAASKIEGSGLGLAITARLVQRMGGRIGHAENPGGGSVFWVEFLPGIQSIAAEGDAPQSQPEHPAKAGQNILLVDDMAMNRDVAAAMLGLAGHKVVCVDSGAAAIEAVRAQNFDIVLMDVRMPGMDGLEATRRIRALPDRRRDVPILAVTAQAFSDQIAQCRDAGMTGHVAKPFEYNALLRAIGNAIAASSSAPAAETVTPPQDSQTPVLDAPAYQTTASFLQPQAVKKHLESLIDRGTALQAMLSLPDALAAPGPLTEAAHALCGAAGAFGFRRLAEAGRQFEHAAETDAPDLAVRRRQLLDAVGLSLSTLREMASEVDVDVGAY